MMQQFPTKRASNTSLVLGLAGLGAVAAYALSSPRRRSELVAAGQSALEVGSRLALASAERVRDVLPDRALDAMSAVRERARGAPARATSASAETLHELVEQASEAMHDVLSRLRALSGDTTQAARRQLRGAADSIANASDGGSLVRSSGRDVVLAAAIIGTALYAMQRYAAGNRISDN